MKRIDHRRSRSRRAPRLPGRRPGCAELRQPAQERAGQRADGVHPARVLHVRGLQAPDSPQRGQRPVARSVRRRGREAPGSLGHARPGAVRVREHHRAGHRQQQVRRRQHGRGRPVGDLRGHRGGRGVPGPRVGQEGHAGGAERSQARRDLRQQRRRGQLHLRSAAPARPGPAGSSADSGGELLVQAQIEADTDRDGFGDETQDQCKNQSGAAGGCDRVKPRLRLPQAKKTRIGYRLSERARVTLKIQKRANGRYRGVRTLRVRGKSGQERAPHLEAPAPGAEDRPLPRGGDRAGRRRQQVGQERREVPRQALSLANTPQDATARPPPGGRRCTPRVRHP